MWQPSEAGLGGVDENTADQHDFYFHSEPLFQGYLHTVLSTWHWSVLVTIPKPFSCERSIKKTNRKPIFKVFLSASILQQFRGWPLQLCLPAFPLEGEMMVMAVSNWHPVTIGLSGLVSRQPSVWINACIYYYPKGRGGMPASTCQPKKQWVSSPSRCTRVNLQKLT